MKIFKSSFLTLIFFFVFFKFTLIPFEQPVKPNFIINEFHRSQPILEIDSKSVKTAEEIGGGVYCHEVDAIVPFFPHLIREEWMKEKNAIAERIGPIYPIFSEKKALWRNSANSIDSLIKDAQMAAPYFWEMCVLIAHKTGATPSFGVGNQNILKSRKSITRKVQESIKLGLSEEEAVSHVRDSLRGTIIVDTPEQIPVVVQSLKEFACEMGREIFFINIWEDNRSSGYVGIHAKMLFPIYDAKKMDTNRNIIVEIQIHLKCIMDGTKTCVKEREQLLYAQMVQQGIDSKIQTTASTLLYLTALKQCPPKK